MAGKLYFPSAVTQSRKFKNTATADSLATFTSKFVCFWRAKDEMESQAMEVDENEPQQ